MSGPGASLPSTYNPGRMTELTATTVPSPMGCTLASSVPPDIHQCIGAHNEPEQAGWPAILVGVHTAVASSDHCKVM